MLPILVLHIFEWHVPSNMPSSVLLKDDTSGLLKEFWLEQSKGAITLCFDEELDTSSSSDGSVEQLGAL